jgi:hypothetical protein
LTYRASLVYNEIEAVKEAFMAHRDDWVPRREQDLETIDTLSLWMQVTALKKAGKVEEAMAFRKKYIPLPAWGAKVMKKFCGADYIRASGYDLSEVEAKLGKSWLDS